MWEDGAGVHGGGGEGVRIGKEDFKRFAVVDESFWNFQR